jgi:single-stranded-DNA-specific exonuclease
LSPVIDLDAELSFSQIDLSLMREIEVMKPFGVGNPEPVFVTRNVEVCDRTNFSAGMRFRFRHSGRNLGGVVFGEAEEFPIVTGQKIDLVYRLTEKEWNGTSSIELRVLDARG